MNTINLDLANIKASEWFGKINTNAVSDAEREYVDKLLTKIALNNVEDSVTFSDSRLVFIASKMLISYGDTEILLNEYGVDEFFIYLSFLKSFYDENNEVRDQLVKFVTIWISYLVSEKPVTKEEAEKMNAASIELFSLLSFEQSEAKAVVPKFVIGALVQASQIEANEVVEPIENADIKDAGLEDIKPEVKVESTESSEVESQIKELQDSIETFQFLIEAGASEEETKELQESIETFKFLLETLGVSEEEQPIAKEENGEKETYFIEFLNKEKSFQKDTKEFDSYEKAEEWAKENFENFNPDIIRMKFANGGGLKEAVNYARERRYFAEKEEELSEKQNKWFDKLPTSEKQKLYNELVGRKKSLDFIRESDILAIWNKVHNTSSDKYAKGGKVKSLKDIQNDPRVSEVWKDDSTGESGYWLYLKEDFISAWDSSSSVRSENLNYIKELLNTEGGVVRKEDYKDEYAMGGRSRTGNYTITDDVGDAVVENADEEGVIFFANTMFHYEAMDSGEEQIETLDEAISALKTMDYSVNTNKKK